MEIVPIITRGLDNKKLPECVPSFKYYLLVFKCYTAHLIASHLLKNFKALKRKKLTKANNKSHVTKIVKI